MQSNMRTNNMNSPMSSQNINQVFKQFAVFVIKFHESQTVSVGSILTKNYKLQFYWPQKYINFQYGLKPGFNQRKLIEFCALMKKINKK